MSDSKRADFGIDAPGIVRMMFMLGSCILALGVILVFALWPSFVWGLFVALASASFFGSGCLMLYGSKVGKLKRRDRLLEMIPWTGSETVLDVGCGRGLLLIGAAKRLTTGKAMGIDVWQAKDQSNNSQEATLANAQMEGVAERVEVHTMDMRSPKFEGETFDVILSHWAVHNIEEKQGRKTALTEMARVLKPGGYLILADIMYHKEYADAFSEVGLKDVKVLVENDLTARLSWLLFFGTIRFATVCARK